MGVMVERAHGFYVRDDCTHYAITNDGYLEVFNGGNHPALTYAPGTWAAVEILEEAEDEPGSDKGTQP